MVRDVLTVQAAGNIDWEIDQCDRRQTVVCNALDVLCVGGTWARNSYNDFLDDVMYQFSSWKNPFDPVTGTRKDAERPDVVSEGQEGWTPVRGQPWHWGENSGHGTSIAAPSVTGLIALLTEQCGEFQGVLLTRAIVRNGAHARQTLQQPDDEIYPIPGYSSDAWAGTGIVTAWGIGAYCEESPSGGGPETDSTKTTTEGGEDVPSWMMDEQINENAPIRQEEWEMYSGELKVGPSTNPKQKVLFDYGDLGGGSRVRVSLSFHTCPGGAGVTIGDTSRPARDIDLALCGYAPKEKRYTCEAVSESVDDTNEGFDVALTHDYEDLKAYAIYPTTTSTGDPLECPIFDTPTVAPMAAASAVWAN